MFSRQVFLVPRAGVIYAIDPAGKMFWYRHNNPTGDSAGFANGGTAKQIL